ncbi:hypothetical protein ABK040_008324 [Willaertia magna]
MKFLLLLTIFLSVVATFVLSSTTTTTTTTSTTTSGTSLFESSSNSPLKLPPLPYSYNSLEPHIDEKTMQVHHTGHHQAYTTNLNQGIVQMKELNNKNEMILNKIKNVETLLANLHLLKIDNEALRRLIRNNGGGYVNHLLFWKMMTPASNAFEPSDKVLNLLQKYFQSKENFVKEFTDQALKVFGSGWTCLLKRRNLQNWNRDHDNVMDNVELTIKSFANQDNSYLDESILLNKNTVSDNKVNQVEEPVLCLDVWEHAYYLKHQNRRAAYISEWWKVVNWKFVEERLFKKEFDVDFIGNVELNKVTRKDEL